MSSPEACTAKEHEEVKEWEEEEKADSFKSEGAAALMVDMRSHISRVGHPGNADLDAEARNIPHGEKETDEMFS